MAKYIPKSALVAEIKKRFDEYTSSILKHYDAYKEAKAQELGKILTILNTLEVKEVDLEKELDKEWNKCEPTDEGIGLEIASIEHEQFDNIAKHFFELGLKAQKGE